MRYSNVRFPPKAANRHGPIADNGDVGQNRRIVSKPKSNMSAKALPVASITNSLLLPTAAALNFNAAFWVLVLTNFVLMHAIWMVPIFVRNESWNDVDWGWHLYRWPLPLLAFALLGIGSYALWGAQLDSVFPS